MKHYIVSWDEKHQITLEAESEREAIEKVNQGDFKEEDKGAEMNGSFEAEEITIN